MQAFLAEQVSLGRTGDLKLVRSEHLFLPGAKDRFRCEVDAIARLQHPAILPAHAVGEDAGVPWLAAVADHRPSQLLPRRRGGGREGMRRSSAANCTIATK